MKRKIQVMKVGTTGGAITLATGRATKTDADVTTTSTSFVDMTGMSITMTTSANRVLLLFTGYTENSSAGNENYFDFDVDGTRQGTNAEGLTGSESEDAATGRCLHMAWLTAQQTAASHTFKTQWKVDGGTGTMFGGGTSGDATQLNMCAVEIPNNTGSTGGGVDDRAVKTDASITTTSTTFVNMTGMSITMTTGARPVLLTFTGYTVNVNSGENHRAFFDFDVDGTRQGTNAEGITGTQNELSQRPRMVCMSWLTNALTAASHTFLVQWKTSGGTARMNINQSDYETQISMSAQEIV